jgi:hypothetical protein
VIERERTLDEAVDREPPARGINLRDAEVGGHVDVLGRSDAPDELFGGHRPPVRRTRIHPDFAAHPRV